VRTIAKRTALEAQAAQKDEFMNWAILGDWANAYRTLGSSK
jgi:isoleucyl-tRNA synthetase